MGNKIINYYVTYSVSLDGRYPFRSRKGFNSYREADIYKMWLEAKNTEAGIKKYSNIKIK